MAIYPGALVTLTAQGADGGEDHSITAYEWKINDILQGGSGSTLTFITVVYGVHNIECRVQNDCGGWSQPAMTSFDVIEKPCPIPTITGITVS